MSRIKLLPLLFLLTVLISLTGCSSGTDNAPSPSSQVSGSPTTSAEKNTCFINPVGPGVPSIYAGNATPSAGPVIAPALKGTAVVLGDGLQYVDIKVGSGSVVKSGSNITANYSGWQASTCQKFDSSYDSHNGLGAQPFSVVIGQGQVIKGWDEGLIGMQAGGLRRLYIPASLAYGEQGAGSIPPNADLIFDVQIVAVQ